MSSAPSRYGAPWSSLEPCKQDCLQISPKPALGPLGRIYEEIESHIPTFRTKIGRPAEGGQKQLLILKMTARSEIGKIIIHAIGRLIELKVNGEICVGVGPATGAERQAQALVEKLSTD